MRGKPLQLVYKENGCIVSISHRLNKDGYLRIRDERYEGKGRKPLIMAHRLMFEECGGVIPKVMNCTIFVIIGLVSILTIWS